ncbi:MAG: RNA polymerase factor sigma-54 [Hyphomicrobiaceae bacterium]
MALSTKLELRQGQALVMTPQLQQAIKLLQLSNLELSAFVEAELERNPLLERDDQPAGPDPFDQTIDRDGGDGPSTAAADQGTDTWMETGKAAVDPAGDLDTDYSNVDPDASTGASAMPGEGSWASVGSRSQAFDDSDPNLEEYVASVPDLADHLGAQLALAIADPVERFIGANLIDMVDDAGYLRGDLGQLADRLGASIAKVEKVLAVMQRFEPSGVLARSLSECLAIQLREIGRYDPMIAAFLDNLHLLARHDFASLRKACGCDMDDITDMVAEVRRLNPKPGLKYGSAPVQTVVPDVIVRPRNDGGWQVELNSETLPKVLVNRSYFTSVTRHAQRGEDKVYLNDCLQSANWLVRSLDQRARTILKVAEEIVRQQDAFLTYGIAHLRPINLKTVADAISMHESTVSRVTSSKYMATNRGVFELKYFFTSAIASAGGGGESHSSEAVRHRIRQLIDAETAEGVLSDDAIVQKLQGEGIDIARRTVAKYREGMNISSSVQRRREKRMAERARVPA